MDIEQLAKTTVGTLVCERYAPSERREMLAVARAAFALGKSIGEKEVAAAVGAKVAKVEKELAGLAAYAAGTPEAVRQR